MEQFPIYYPEEVTEQVDVVIVFTKACSWRTCYQPFNQSSGLTSAVVCLLNGLGHEVSHEAICGRREPSHGLYHLVSRFRRSPGRAVLHGVGSLSLQNFVDTPSARAKTKPLWQP